MKHRADIAELERSGAAGTAGRHAQAKRGKASKAYPAATSLQDAPAAEAAPTNAPVPPGDGVDAPPTADPVVMAPPTQPVDPPVDSLVDPALDEHHPPTAAELGERPSIISTGKWRTRSVARTFAFLVLLLTAGAVGITGRMFAEVRSDDHMNMLVAAALTMAGLWALLTATAPQIVSLRGSLLTVKTRRGIERFDLADGMQQVDLVGSPRSAKWQLVLHRGDSSTLQLNRRDVDAVTLDPAVRHFREIAQRRRSEHWARLGL